MKVLQSDSARLWAPFFTMAIAGSVAVVLAQPFHDDGYTEASFSTYISPLVTASVPIAICAALLARRGSGLLTFCLGSLVAGAVGGVLYAMQSGADTSLGADRGDIALAFLVNAIALLYPLGVATYVLLTLLLSWIAEEMRERQKDPR